MKNPLLMLLKPETRLARWIIALLLIAIFVIGALGYAEPVKELLDSEALTFKVGNISLSLYNLLKGTLILIIIFWTASVVSDAGERRFKKRPFKSEVRQVVI